MTGNSHNILVVDDESHFRELLSNILLFAGYEVLTADSGNAAIALCDTNKPDLILLDLVMPGLSGIETCERLKAIPHLKETPVVILTSINNTTVITKSFEAGATDFMVKPVNKELLKQRAAYTISNQEMRRALKIKEVELSDAQRTAGMGTLRINSDTG